MPRRRMGSGCWVELMLWPTVSRPIRLGVRHSFGADNWIALRFGAPSLTRRRVCNLYCNLSVVRHLEEFITIHYCLIWDYWVSFTSLLRTRRDYGGSILTCLHTGVTAVLFGSGCTDPRFLDLGTSWRWVVSFMLPYSLHIRLGGPHSRSGRRAERKILHPTRNRTPTPRSSRS
jgi:hypothetical protein